MKDIDVVKVLETERSEYAEDTRAKRRREYYFEKTRDEPKRSVADVSEAKMRRDRRDASPDTRC